MPWDDSDSDIFGDILEGLGDILIEIPWPVWISILVLIIIIGSALYLYYT